MTLQDAVKSPLDNWIGAYYGQRDFGEVFSGDIYLLAVYWALQTLTTVG